MLRIFYLKITSLIGKYKKSMSFALSTFIVGGLNALTLPIFTRLLSQADYGILSVTTNVQNFSTSVFRLGTHQSVLKQYLDFKKKEKNNYLYSVLLFSSLWSFVLIGFSILISQLGYFKAFKDVEFFPYLLLALLTSSFSVGYAIFQSELRILNLAKQYIFLTVFYVAISIGLSIVLIYYYKLGVVGKLLGNVIPYFIIFIYLVLFKQTKFKFKYWVTAIKFGVPLSLSTLFSSFIMLYAIGVLADKLTMADLGVFQITKNLGLLLPQILFQAITLTYLPLLYKSFKENDILKITKSNTGLILFFILILSIVVIATPLIIKLFTTKEYLSGTGLMRVFVVSYIFKIIHYVPMIELFYRGKTTWVSIIEILSLTVFVLSLNYTISNFGLIGVGFSFVIQEVIKSAAYFYLSRLRINEIFSFRLLK